MVQKIRMTVTMRYNGTQYFLAAVLFVFLGGCSKKSSESPAADGIVVEAIEGDVDSFNPLFAQDANAGEINDLLYPALMNARFDTSAGMLEYQPLIAKSWEIENGNVDLRFHLRTDGRWSDGAPLTARDVQLSYVLYCDTQVASLRQNSIKGLKKSSTGTLDVRQAVEVVNDSDKISVHVHFGVALRQVDPKTAVRTA